MTSELKGRLLNLDRELQEERVSFEQEQSRLRLEKEQIILDQERYSKAIAQSVIESTGVRDIFASMQREIFSGEGHLLENINYQPAIYHGDISTSYRLNDRGSYGPASYVWEPPKISGDVKLSNSTFDLIFAFNNVDEWTSSPYPVSEVVALSSIYPRRIRASVRLISGEEDGAGPFYGGAYTFDFMRFGDVKRVSFNPPYGSGIAFRIVENRDEIPAMVEQHAYQAVYQYYRAANLRARAYR